MSLLEHINDPSDLRKLAPEQLPALAQELRTFLKDAPGKAGHLRSSLGVAELSIALHYLFQTPKDILIWDVGHQAYAHKALTERKSRFHTNRQRHGLSGFTRREESAYDPFGTGHSATSISALMGFLTAAKLQGSERKHIAVIGDGALTGGLAFEALNHLGETQSDCLIILNDNQNSIDPNVGALQKFTSYQKWAEALGFSYHHLAEGNSIPALLDTIKGLQSAPGPQFLHLRTKTEPLADTSIKAPSSPPGFGEALHQELAQLMKKDERLVVVSPAMLSGAGLLDLKAQFPERVIDVGIAEQHAVTMAAGLAAAGMRPIVHLYSTFAQRALDQVIHDVCLQKLAVTFLIDRAGIVGADGPTHHGVFDQGMVQDLPHLRIGTAADDQALLAMLRWSLEQEQDATWIRYAKEDFPSQSRWRSYRPHWWWQAADRSRVMLSYGAMAHPAQAAAEALGWSHLHVPIYKPFPEGDIREQLKDTKQLITIDENPRSASLAAAIDRLGLDLERRDLHLPDHFVPHGTRSELLEEYQLSEAGIRALVQAWR